MHPLFERRVWLALVILISGVFLTHAAPAHHGWGWATEEEFELTGKITGLRLGNPHGELTLNVNGKSWIVEVGQPWRNERAGLRKSLLSVGQVITAYGHRSSKANQLLMKAERVVIDGKSYNLYPDRKS